MWIARDANNSLWLYEEKPTKKEEYWSANGCKSQSMLFNDWFPEVQWDDDEPRELILK